MANTPGGLTLRAAFRNRRIWVLAVAFVTLSLPGLSCWLLTGSALAYSTAAVAIFLIGFAPGIEYDVIAYCVSRYFGLRSYSEIYGFLYTACAGDRIGRRPISGYGRTIACSSA